MNIHLPAILGFTARYQGFDPSPNEFKHQKLGEFWDSTIIDFTKVSSWNFCRFNQQTWWEHHRASPTQMGMFTRGCVDLDHLYRRCSFLREGRKQMETVGILWQQSGSRKSLLPGISGKTMMFSLNHYPFLSISLNHFSASPRLPKFSIIKRVISWVDVEESAWNWGKATKTIIIQYWLRRCGGRTTMGMQIVGCYRIECILVVHFARHIHYTLW